MRIDAYLAERGFCESRSRAQEAIRSGAVTVNGVIVTKPSCPVGAGDAVEISAEGKCPYVSRGGLKLEAALDAFGADPRGQVCADIGASSGGFTDCLLRRGARRVYAVDSGRDQLHPSLRDDPRVIAEEGVNARYLSAREIPESIGFLTMDVSFISQTKLYPALLPLLAEDAAVITLIKPQFEAGPAGVGKGGIVRDEKTRRRAVETVLAAAEAAGLIPDGVIPSPIRGGDGNIEFLACFHKKTSSREKGGTL